MEFQNSPPDRSQNLNLEENPSHFSIALIPTAKPAKLSSLIQIAGQEFRLPLVRLAYILKY